MDLARSCEKQVWSVQTLAQIQRSVLRKDRIDYTFRSIEATPRSQAMSHSLASSGTKARRKRAREEQLEDQAVKHIENFKATKEKDSADKTIVFGNKPECPEWRKHQKGLGANLAGTYVYRTMDSDTRSMRSAKLDNGPRDVAKVFTGFVAGLGPRCKATMLTEAAPLLHGSDRIRKQHGATLMVNKPKAPKSGPTKPKKNKVVLEVQQEKKGLRAVSVEKPIDMDVTAIDVVMNRCASLFPPKLNLQRKRASSIHSGSLEVVLGSCQLTSSRPI